MPIISLRNLKKRFGKLVVLDGVSLDIEAGSSVVVLGPSGTGKSVLLKHIVGLLKPDHGEVYFEGDRIDVLSERKLDPVRQNFGFLFQMGALFDSMTNIENVAFPLLEHTAMGRDEAWRVAQEKLEMVGLSDVARKMPAELSGGMRKRVALARAIAMNPKVILYDEPTTGLDPIRSDMINELILKLQREMKITSIVVTHDMASAFKVANRMIMLFEGKIRFDGTPEQIRESKDELVRRFVSGESDDDQTPSLM